MSKNISQHLKKLSGKDWLLVILLIGSWFLSSENRRLSSENRQYEGLRIRVGIQAIQYQSLWVDHLKNLVAQGMMDRSILIDAERELANLKRKEKRAIERMRAEGRR